MCSADDHVDHTFESMYVCQESRRITQDLLKQRSALFNRNTIVYVRNFQKLCRDFKSMFDLSYYETHTPAGRNTLLKRVLNSELLFVENIRCLAIDVVPPQLDDTITPDRRPFDGRSAYAASILPILGAFQDLKELKVILNVKRYTATTQKPSRLLVGSAHLLAATSAAGSNFDSGWHLDSIGRQALDRNYSLAMSDVEELEYVLQSKGHYWGQAWWGISENGVKLMEGLAFTPPSQPFLIPYLLPWNPPDLGCTRNLQISIAQWQKPDAICYQHGGSKTQGTQMS